MVYVFLHNVDGVETIYACKTDSFTKRTFKSVIHTSPHYVRNGSRNAKVSGYVRSKMLIIIAECDIFDERFYVAME